MHVLRRVCASGEPDQAHALELFPEITTCRALVPKNWGRMFELKAGYEPKGVGPPPGPPCPPPFLRELKRDAKHAVVHELFFELPPPFKGLWKKYTNAQKNMVLDMEVESEETDMFPENQILSHAGRHPKSFYDPAYSKWHSQAAFPDSWFPYFKAMTTPISVTHVNG